MDANTIVADVRTKIISGEYPHGSRLPTVREQMGVYGVSQQTASAAYSSLAALGMVRITRNGTHVAAGKRSDAHLGTFLPPDLAAAKAWKPTESGTPREETTLVRQLDATADMAEEWGIPEGTTVVERTRIRYVDDVAVQHKLTVMPYDIAARVPEGFTGTPPMLTPAGEESVKAPAGTRVSDWLGWGTAHTECIITADPMDGPTAEALGLPVRSPGFRIVGIARDSEGRTVMATVTTAQLHHRVTLGIVG